MIKDNIKYKPSIAIHPGVTLKENLDILNISNKELSIRTGVTEKHISEVVNEKTPITPEFAIKIEKATGLSAVFLSNLQSNYDIILSNIKAREKLSKEVKTLDFYNYKELVSFDLVKDFKDKLDKVLELQKYFQVDSLEFIPSINQVAFRNANNKINIYSLYSWLRFGEIKSQNIEFDLCDFDPSKLKSKIPDMKKLILKKGNFFTDLQKLCAECGVVLVHTPYFKNTVVNGAVRWYKDRPLIQINSKGAFSDIFWFTFFHEIGHIILHGKKDKFIDYNGNSSNIEEKEADNFASEVLIPDLKYKEISSKKSLTVAELKSFCEEVGVDMGVVIGRFAYNGLIPYSTANRFRQKVSI